MITVSAYLPKRPPGPGRLAAVPLDVLSLGPAELVLPGAIVRDERPLPLLNTAAPGDLLADPAGGGGPLGSAERDRSARLFGLTNVAFHTQRALTTAAELLGRPLPPLLVRIGRHESPRRWGGGHYRVAARQYDEPEPGGVRPTGEVHLGGGSGFAPAEDGTPYFAAPAHNLAIIYHEIGHHLTRHTADFRLNRLRPAGGQTNKKVALDEGTADWFTAIMLDQSDIYAWHRGHLATNDPGRRALQPLRTMADFRGGQADPHTDGTVWASACWTAREHVAAAGHDRARFDRMLVRGLDLSALPYTTESRGHGGPTSDELKQRRYIAGLLDAVLRADPALAEPVLAGMAIHGIHLGASNVELRQAARAAKAA